MAWRFRVGLRQDYIWARTTVVCRNPRGLMHLLCLRSSIWRTKTLLVTSCSVKVLFLIKSVYYYDTLNYVMLYCTIPYYTVLCHNIIPRNRTCSNYSAAPTLGGQRGYTTFDNSPMVLHHPKVLAPTLPMPQTPTGELRQGPATLD